MASRMDRYHQREERSVRNEELYKSIENLGNYTNIEGVIAIDKTNEIDITRVKAMLKSREEYQKGKQYRQLVSEEEPEEEPVPEEVEEEKNYDIRDVLTKAKDTRTEPIEDYRVLKNVNYDVAEKISPRKLQKEEVTKELVESVTIPKPDLTDAKEEEAGLFDSLKSDTMVGDPSSIKKIIEEAKEEEQKQAEEKRLEESNNLGNIDTTFFTSSLGFKDSDFEDLKNLGENIKKHNVLLRVLIVCLVLVGLSIVVVLLIQFLNK